MLQLRDANAIIKIEIDNLKLRYNESLKSLENEWSQRYQKLNEEKNEEITRQLKKSIDLIDENELIENQLEKLYALIDEKNVQINCLEEREFIYQNEIKKLKNYLNSFDINDHKYKFIDTQDKTTNCEYMGTSIWNTFIFES